MSNRRKQNATLVDLFAGCGGLSLGLEMAGFRPVFASEINTHARETYLVNRRHLGLVDGRDVVGDITQITRSPAKLKALARRLRREHGDVTLVAGGPPCQGFSARGIRTTFAHVTRQSTPSNHLYRDMAKVIAAVGPEFYLFENVRGLLTARWTPSGTRGEIWRSVQSTFNRIQTYRNGVKLGYIANAIVVKASQFGVPQNRPRLLLLGVRTDIAAKWKTTDIASRLTPSPTAMTPPDLIDLLGDLVDSRGEKLGKTPRYPRSPRTPVQRHLRTRSSGRVSVRGEPVTDHEYTRHSPHVTRRFQFMLEESKPLPSNLKIKKFAQRALPARWKHTGPSITATSAPDDYVHFCRPRILTVREWARLQMFPDWYRFCGPRTTGGRRRAGDLSIGNWERELPKYTQIGNAVPIPLAKALGQHLISIRRG